jgi:predicted DNA-binding protein YlxM (UPF0122 family)
MAKGKYERWLTEDGLVLLRGWARDGLSNEQIAKNMGISAKTLYDWLKAHGKISEAIKKGKEVSDFEVENALHSKAIGGDVAAMIFWLVNRKPDRWQNKRDIRAEVDGTIAKPPTVHVYLPKKGGETKDG